MKAFRKLLLATLIASATAHARERVDLPFWDTSGQSFSTGTFGDVLVRKFPGTDPVLFLIATARDDLPTFRRQSSAIDALGHEIEDLEIMIATANAEREDKSGYWLTRGAAHGLLGGKDFVVIVLKRDGTVCSKSSTALGSASIRQLAGRCR